MADNFKTIRSGISLGNLAADPANGANGDFYFNTTLNSFRGFSNGSWGSLGGAGSNGSSVNFIGLNSSLQPVNSNDINAENSIGNWIVYQDTAGVIPVNMAGTVTDPSPITLTRTTTGGQVLNGSGSFLITKPAANKQGEGVSVSTFVPPAYLGQNTLIQIPFKVISGTLAMGDLAVFVYDITNSKLITPINNLVLGSQGVIAASFSLPSSTSQLRIGIHFASTSTSALILSYDDVFMGYSEIVGAGPVISDWSSSLSFIPVQFGTPQFSTWFTRRVGDSMEVRGSFEASSVNAAIAQLTLPAGFALDTTKLITPNPFGLNVNRVGTYTASVTTGSHNIFPDDEAGVMFYDGSDASHLYFSLDTSGGTLNKDNASVISLGDNNAVFHFEFTIPVLGWSSQTASVNSGIINMSQILSSGTRVTGTPPTSLGQYRSYLRNASTNTFTETNGTPTILPTAINGIAIYNSGSFGTGDSSGQPSKYEIFVGQNKSIRLQTYSSTGRTGYLEIDPFVSGSTAYGYIHSYDQTTGIILLTPNTQGPATTMETGVNDTGAVSTSPIYFDIIVADNDFQIQLLNSNFFASSQITTTSSGISGGTFQTFSNSPAFTITPNQSGIYKVYCSIPLVNDSTDNNLVVARIFNTSGSGTLLYESQGLQYNSTSVGGSNPLVQSVYTLIRGNTYVFDIQGKVSNGTGPAIASGSNAPFYIFAELV